MNERDKDRLAAEYALGTLDAAEWANADLMRRVDPAFARAVTAWEARLAPLGEAVRDERPPAALWQRLEASLDRRAAETKAGAGAPQIVTLERRVSLWRGATVALAALAVVALALVGKFGVPGFESTAAQRYVAMLHNGEGHMGYVVTVEPEARRVLVRNMGTAAPAKKDFELWLMYRNGSKPLGLVRRDGSMTMSLPKEVQVAQLEHDAQVVVCLEPKGGRPPGKLGMGPIVYSGNLVRQTPSAADNGR